MVSKAHTNNKEEIISRPPEFQYLEQIITFRLDQHFGNIPSETEPPPFPPLKKWSLHLPDFMMQALNKDEATILLIALAPHIQPDLFDHVIESKLQRSGDFREIGGIRGNNFRGFLPTGETVLFLLAGTDQKKRYKIQQMFHTDHFFAKQQMLWLEELSTGEPAMSGKIIMSQEYLELLTFGKITRPRFGIQFPAQLIETHMEWEDLVLPAETLNQIQDLQMWVRHGNALLHQWEMSRKLKPGYRVLFYGPPGTGKTLTASLLGKYTGKDVYKIDLSMVVSKFIGETEKNLASLFDKAKNKEWILFFDEADALFGKRTNVRDAHDKYANQEVSYLLQRTEDYPGLVILATNFKSNIDEAFTRRFQSHIYFPPPKYEERVLLWKKSFPLCIRLEEKIDIPAIARQYELTGAHIMNIVQHACLRSLSRQSEIILWEDLLEGIRKEYVKEGKII